MENDGGLGKFLLLLLFHTLIMSLSAEKIFKFDEHESSNKSKDLPSGDSSDKNLKRMKDILNGMQIDSLFSTRSDIPSRRTSFSKAESSKKKDCTESLIKDATNFAHARTDLLPHEIMPYQSSKNFAFPNPYFNDGQFRNEKLEHHNRESSHTNNHKSALNMQPKQRIPFQEDFNTHRPTLNPHVDLREISPTKLQQHNSFLNIGQSAHSIHPGQKGSLPQVHPGRNTKELRITKEKYIENNNPVANHFFSASQGEYFDKQRLENMKKDYPFFNIKPHQNIDGRQVYGNGVNNQQNLYPKRPLVPESRGIVYPRMPSGLASNFDSFLNSPRAIDGTKSFFSQGNYKLTQLKSPRGLSHGSSFKSSPQAAIKPAFHNGDIRSHDPLTKPRSRQNSDSYDAPKGDFRQSGEDTVGNYPKSEAGSLEDLRGFSVTPSGRGSPISRSVSYSQSSYGQNSKDIPSPTSDTSAQPMQKYTAPLQQPYSHNSEEVRDPTPPLHQSPKSDAQRGTPYNQEHGKSNNVGNKYYNTHNSFHNAPQSNSFGGSHNNHNAPQGNSLTVPQNNLHNEPHSSPHNVPQKGLQSGPHSISHRNPQSGSQKEPQRNPQGPLYNNPFSGPYNSPLSGSFNSPLSGSYNSPFSGPLNSPLSGSLNSPLSGSLNNPLSGPLDNPRGGPLDNPRGGPHNSPHSNNHGTTYSNPISGPHGSQRGSPYMNSDSGSYERFHGGPHVNSYGDPYMGSHGSPQSGEQLNYSPHAGYGDSQYNNGYSDDSQYHSQPVQIDKNFFNKYGISDKAKIIVAEAQPNEHGKLEYVADGEKGIKPGDPAHPNPDYDAYRNSRQNPKSGRHSKRRPHRAKGRHSKRHRERMHRESTTQVNDHFHRRPMHINEQSSEQNYKNHANKQQQADSSRFNGHSSEQNHNSHFNKQQPGDFSRYNEHSSEQSYQNNAFRQEQSDSVPFNENSAEKYHSQEFKPQQTKELIQNHGNGISRVIYSVPSAKKLSKLF